MPEHPDSIITIPLQVSVGLLTHANDHDLKKMFGDQALQAARKELAKRVRDA